MIFDSQSYYFVIVNRYTFVHSIGSEHFLRTGVPGTNTRIHFLGHSIVNRTVIYKDSNISEQLLSTCNKSVDKHCQNDVIKVPLKIKTLFIILKKICFRCGRKVQPYLIFKNLVLK